MTLLHHNIQLMAGQGDSPISSMPIPLMITFFLVSLGIMYRILNFIRRPPPRKIQERRIENEFSRKDGKDLVEIHAPSPNVPAHQIALIANSYGYVFAWSYIPRGTLKHTYVFRKIFTSPRPGPVI